MSPAGIPMDSPTSRTLLVDQREAVYLLLKRCAPTHERHVAVGLSQFIISGVVGAGSLGTGARPAAETARGMAFRRAGCDLSHGLLFRVSAFQIPPSDRT